MRRMFSLALAALAIATTLSALVVDNSIGTWKANVTASKYTPAPWPVKSLTVVREAAPGGVRVTNTGERTDGTPIASTYTAMYDGTSTAVTGKGSPYDSIAIKQVDPNTFTYEAKSTTSKYHATGQTVISSDGKTMTTTATGTDADGNPMTLTLVYDKQ
jgi:hypothetical protein